MIPVDQTITGFVKGNCMQACIASILELPIDALPNFMEDGEEHYAEKINEWSEDKPFVLMDIRFVERDGYDTHIKGMYTIATGTSPRDNTKMHAVIYFNGMLAHDPHPDKTGIVGEPDHYTVFIVKDAAQLLKEEAKNG